MATSPTTAPSSPTTTADPGALAQTDVLPSPDDTAFRAAVAGLWQGIVEDSLAPALTAFFPESAYLQVKTVADPAADFQQRLVAEFRLDLSAAHHLLGADPSAATFQSVRVPQAYAHWVSPGVCANRVGYYEVAHARVVYVQAGTVHSFGIASLISWRGQWYVVHLGAVVRTGASGVVDDPETGPGTSPPSTTC